MDEFAPELDDREVRNCRSLTVRDLQIIAARPVEGGPAEPWQVAAMVDVATAVMGRPQYARPAALAEAASALVEAPAPIVAAALVEMISTTRQFQVCDLITIVGRRLSGDDRAAENAAA